MQKKPTYCCSGNQNSTYIRIRHMRKARTTKIFQYSLLYSESSLIVFSRRIRRRLRRIYRQLFTDSYFRPYIRWYITYINAVYKR